MQPKMKKIVIATSIIGAIAILTGAFIIRSKRKKLQAQIQSGSPDIIEPAKQTTTSVLFPLKRGSGTNTAEKNAVKVVQRYINAKGLVHWWLQINPLTEDGIFGEKTETALNKLASVKQVSFSFYKEMQSFLTPVPSLLAPGATSYKSSLDPQVAKNDIAPNALNLFM